MALGALALLMVTWFVLVGQEADPVSTASTVSSQKAVAEPKAPATVAATAVNEVVAMPVAGSHPEGTAKATAKSPAIAAASSGANSSSSTSARQDTGMVIGDRKWQLVGTQALERNGATLTTLVLQDPVSGQQDFRLSQLRFSLAPGADYEGFIAAIPGASRLFVNTLYGEVALDPANIAAVYAALTKDPRVTNVEFVAIPPLVKFK